MRQGGLFNMPNRFNFTFHVSKDGKTAVLYKERNKYIHFLWNDKKGGFETIYSKGAYQQEMEKNPVFCRFIQDLLTYMLAYKQDADKLHELHDAFERLINE